jgi:EAL domain-containing protein (putative c-di-GMP-specific phosphodiesterase class I)
MAAAEGAARTMSPPGSPARPAGASAAPSVLQLLSFIFASADMVMEITTDGAVSFATGASQRLLGRAAESLIGVSWRDLIDPSEAELVQAALQDLGPGERRGPFRISLDTARGPQPATLSLFQVPQRDDRISVALSVCHPSFAQVPTDDAGLASRADFEAAATSLLKDAERAGLSMHIDLLEFEGLTTALEALEPAEALTTRRKFGAVLRAASYGGLPAAVLGGDRFAMVRSGKGNPDALGLRVRELAGAGVQMLVGELALNAGSPGETLRAIHHALGRCIEEGPPAAAKSFESALRQTVSESARFKDLLTKGAFELVYQPVVDLKTRNVHHYEALTRFEGGGGPAATIQLAEELGLVMQFDLTIVGMVAAALIESPAEVRIAANISGYSLQQPGFVDQVLAATAHLPKLRKRLLLEITESHQLTDLDAANILVQQLRTAGHEVCLDDFGAGAASLDYLRRLETDVVKFDGRFVRSLETRPRDATLLKRLAELCRELGVATVAEMIETEEVARLAAEAGVEFGQGWLFGRPVSKPSGLERAPAASGPAAARRKGETTTWG